MTKLYLKPQAVHAWPDAHEDGTPGFAFTDDSGQLKWMAADEFKAAHIEIGHLTDVPVSQQGIEITHAILKGEAETLAAVKNGDKYPQMTKEEQQQVNYDLDSVLACIGVLANKIATFSLPKG